MRAGKLAAPMRILVFAPKIPATSRMPGSPRLFNLCRELAKRHELLLITRASPSEQHQSFISDPQTPEVFSRVEVLPDPPKPSWWGQQRHRLHRAASFETRYRQPNYYRFVRQTIRDLCVREEIDVIYADLLSTAQYLDRRMSAPAIVDLHDSMILLFRRTVKSQREWRPKLAAFLNLLSAHRLERNLAKTFDLIITNSTVDDSVIREFARTAQTLIITNGVDTEYFTPVSDAPTPDTIVFTGVMGYAPNEDAAMYFVSEIFPLVREKRPDAEFWIVGSAPSEQVKALGRIDGIHVTGHVDDVRPYVRNATVFVCPLRFGSGVKNKILAAMAMQKPIVATSISVEGLDIVDDREALLADEPSAFAAKVVRLLVDDEEARRLGTNGLATVGNKYSWAAMGQALETALIAVAARRS
jgi:glycosyltransferase involved in cell wall biosynthesis